MSEARLPSWVFRRKVALSIFIGIFIVMMGVSYQYYYTEERLEYRDELIEAYRNHYQSDPKEPYLRHWTTLALGRYGLDKVEKQYIDTKEDGK